jgi:hypothetical protein
MLVIGVDVQVVVYGTFLWGVHVQIIQLRPRILQNQVYTTPGPPLSSHDISRNNSILDTVDLDNDPWEHETTGYSDRLSLGLHQKD